MNAVAGYTSTLSKHPALFPGNAPVWLGRADGACVWDERNRRYIDWSSGVLAVILGHNHPEVNEAVIKHLRVGGPSWSLAHPLEEEVAQTIRRLVGFADGQVRFFKTGSEACSAAVRIARAVTGREKIVSAGYHGWHDGFVAATPPAWGVPARLRELMVPVSFNDLQAAENPFFGLDKNGDDESEIGPNQIAAIIVEPETLEAPQPGYLAGLRRLCDRYGAFLVFDECITGGRYPEFTASRHYEIQPDLLVLSKCLANGWPLACVVGDAAEMSCFELEWDRLGRRVAGPVYTSGTFSTETASLAAAQATLRVWEREQAGSRLQAMGSVLRAHLQGAIEQIGVGNRVQIKGPDYRLALVTPSLQDRTALLSGLLARGQLVGTGANLMLAHMVQHVNAYGHALLATLNHLDEPAGRLVVQPFRQNRQG